MKAARTVTLQEGNMRKRESRSWRKRNLCDWWTNTEMEELFAPSIQLKGIREATQNLNQDPTW